jgi:uncharacterized protein (DUF302 family)
MSTRYFLKMSHSGWMSTYYGRAIDGSYLYILGNPLIAKEMLKHDMAVGLNIPPRVLVQEMEGGGTRVQYDLPSSWFTENPSPELRSAMEDLDRKLEAMLRKVLI